MVERGAATLLPESELSPQRLAAELERLGADRGALRMMAERAQGSAEPQATAAMAAAELAAGGLA